MKQKSFILEERIIGKVQFFETLHVIRDERGDVLFTGSKEAAVRIQRLLNAERKRKAKR